MKFLNPERDNLLELSLDDVFIVPTYFDGTSRMDVNLTPVDFGGSSNPIVAANMNAVTGKRMAETMARYGGIGVLPQDMDLATVERIVRHIKQANPIYDTALRVTSDATLRDVQGLILKRAHDMVVVVDDDEKPLGIITHADLREKDQYTPAAHLMQTRLVTVNAGISNREAFIEMEQQRVKAAPVVNEAGEIMGVITRDDAVRMELLSPSLNSKGELMVAAAVGISAQAGEQAAKLVEMGVDVLVLDTAHGHQRRMLEALKAVRKVVGPNFPLVAGNVCTAEGTRALIEAGADIIKVNVGPGAMCTTRMQTGVGRPTFSSVRACADAARALGKHVWADGGVRHGRDVALYLAAGASRVMVGTTLAGTFESPGDIKEDKDGFLYKENYGMASARAVKFRTTGIDPFDQAKKSFFQEGISTSRIYLRPGLENVGAILVNFITGVQSAFTYIGVDNIDDFHQTAVIGVQTASGFGEGTPHGKVRR
ncbi:MAG: GuaB1 family IMP dehydrogenase-related protein [Deltaproteobacteria bacterium]|jgi:IMP dehydrogenase|nr:GuaB1 family IMP dehydrogenase-related protein [Deltaproteobacteria bacterium]MBT6491494.1 GuaB1 family IMP dehydrogenase-related protein [Deltaproteobacteria bacterium]